jgi:glycosyltransferase involved in cell wall biosynthesis
MKILHVTQGYSPGLGGTEWMVQRVSEEMVRQFGDEVTVFTTNCYSGEAFFTPKLPRLPVGHDEINGVKIRRFPVYSWVSKLARWPQAFLFRWHIPGNQYARALAGGPIIPGLGDAIRQFDYDVLMASSFPLLHMFTALKAAQQDHRPCIFAGGLHPLDEWGFQRPMIFRAIQQADRYIAYTSYEADYVIQRGANPDQVAVIGLGVDLAPFQEVSFQQARQRLNLAEDVPLIGFIGQLGGHKGVDALVRAMPLVWKVFPNAHFLLAGAKTLFAKRLDVMLADFSPEDRGKIILRYNFPDEEKPWLFSAVDVFAYPSGYESFGIAFVEAWAVKKPVIGCFRGAIPSVVDAGRDGLLVKYQAPDALADAMILMLSNPTWARSLGERGYQKAITKYNWPEVARRFHQIYAASTAKAA